ncbi:hypothetical protein KKF32_02705 [Patescibacteria group bacterium]|nr:hypothetical protein [Patescibacteria group bacterium]
MFDQFPSKNSTPGSNNFKSDDQPAEPQNPRPIPPIPPRNEAGSANIPSPEDKLESLKDTMPVSSPPPLSVPKADSAEDMFKETERPSFPQAPAIEETPPMAGPPEPLTTLPDDTADTGTSNKKFYWIGLIVLIIVVAGGGYYVFSKFFKANPDELPLLNINTAGQQNINMNQNINTPPQSNGNVNENTDIDSDKDGLTDTEEADLGTDPMEPDSDGDGLFDREEARIYNTNPLNPDTDGDGYLDGEEVDNGYNPLGPGRMLDINN